MKIVVNTDNYEILNSIIRAAKEHGDEILIAKLEKKLFELIENPENGAYVLGNNKPYSQKAVDFIKKHSPPKNIGKHSKKNSSVLNFIASYLNNTQKDFVLTGKYKIKYLKYDWSLNEQKIKK